jgi:hypothetical protein
MLNLLNTLARYSKDYAKQLFGLLNSFFQVATVFAAALEAIWKPHDGEQLRRLHATLQFLYEL